MESGDRTAALQRLRQHAKRIRKKIAGETIDLKQKIAVGSGANTSGAKRPQNSPFLICFEGGAPPEPENVLFKNYIFLKRCRWLCYCSEYR